MCKKKNQTGDCWEMKSEAAIEIPEKKPESHEGHGHGGMGGMGGMY